MKLLATDTKQFETLRILEK